MIYSLLGLILIIPMSTIYYYVYTKKDVKKEIVLKILGVFLICLYFLRLFNSDAFNNLDLTTLFKTTTTIQLMNILRGLSQASLVFAICAAFFSKEKVIKFILTFITPIISILNLIFINQHNLAFIGTINFNHYVIIEFIYENAIILLISSFFIKKTITSFIKKEKIFNYKEVLTYILVYLITIILAAPNEFFEIISGLPEFEFMDFKPFHRAILYFCVLSTFFTIKIFKNKQINTQKLMLVILATSAFMTFFYSYHWGSFKNLSSLPLHLCNTAIIFMLIAVVFNIKSLFYFTYFVNVLGAVAAMLFPTISSKSFFSDASIKFWYNHYYDFIIPITAVGIGYFKRPETKEVLLSLIAFTGYFIAVLFANSFFVNFPSGSGVDYFFLNGDVIVKHIGFLKDIKNTFILNFDIGKYHFKIYWLYCILVYIGFVFLTFFTLLVYNYLYQTSDLIKEMIIKNKIRKIRLENTKENYNFTEEEVKIMQDSIPSIKITNFSKKYSKNDFYSVKDFNLEVKPGDILGFIGHNGAGKSTVIKSLVGIQSITEGKIEVCGFDIYKNPKKAKFLMGYVPDNHALYERLTGREYIYYIADLYQVDKKTRDERFEKYVNDFNIASAIDRQIKSYSHGMKQKISVISALIHNPKVWILDEPLTGLDPTSTYQIKTQIKKHAEKGNIVFFSSHVIEVVENVCNKIAIINNGNLVVFDTVENLKKKYKNLERAYLENVVENKK